MNDELFPALFPPLVSRGVVVVVAREAEIENK